MPPPDMPDAAAPVLGILIAVLFALVVIGGIAAAYTYARRSVRKARITQRAEGWGGREHPNQSLDGAEPTAPALDAAQSLLSLLPRASANGGSDAAGPQKPAA